MVSRTNLKNTRESVIVVADASRIKGMVNALDWALEHVVRRKDTVIAIGVWGDTRKKINVCHCFPLNMGNVNFSGILELGLRDIGEEIERLREQYQAILKPFNQKCKRNEVKLVAKLALGICAAHVTLKEAANSNTRWIVLDSHLKKYRMCIYWNVECNVAVMKGKDAATLMLSRANEPDYSHVCSGRVDAETWPDDRPPNDPENGNPNVVEEGESPILQTPRGSSWHPLTVKASISHRNDGNVSCGRVQLKQRLKVFFMSVKDHLCKHITNPKSIDILFTCNLNYVISKPSISSLKFIVNGTVTNDMSDSDSSLDNHFPCS
ncbi:hypothetical protein V6N13_102801 [Hibiscus sabdariffa]|uniref:Uncharacterized protein n=1 Tax=Hibiscus sabdariffa TaxID=183260 RepID=A0ABR2D559_9ROSI